MCTPSCPKAALLQALYLRPATSKTTRVFHLDEIYGDIMVGQGQEAVLLPHIHFTKQPSVLLLKLTSHSHLFKFVRLQTIQYPQN